MSTHDSITSQPESAMNSDGTRAERANPDAGLSAAERAAAERAATDGSAIDALLGEVASQGASTEVGAGRIEALGKLLALLDQMPGATDASGTLSDSQSNREVLVDLTLARVARARRVDADIRERELCLSAEDEDALELMVARGLDPESVPARVRERCARQAAILALLESTPPGFERSGGLIQTSAERERLVVATIARVRDSAGNTRHGEAPLGDALSSEDRARFGDRKLVLAGEARGGSWRNYRLGDLVSVAAMLLIGGAVVAPIMSAMRASSQRAVCSSNLSAAGLGFGLYASDYRESLPMASASPAGSAWWQVGQPERSNSANLFTLVRTQYAKVSDLACPGNATACEALASNAQDWRELEQVSYSYQNMFARERPRWTQPARVVVVADRSPIVPLAQGGLVINPMSNSLNHRSVGQHVLWNDRSVEFLRTPLLANRDNIYLPRFIEEALTRLSDPNSARPLTGKESPAGADDVFLGP